MDTLVWITAVYIVLTKYLDCWTTVRFVRRAEVESNALTSCLMRRFGFVRAVIPLGGGGLVDDHKCGAPRNLPQSMP